MTTSELSPELAQLFDSARTLPRELVRQVADFAEFLGRKHAAKPIDESDSWGEDDLRDWTKAAAARLDEVPPAE